ncbi:MAG: hypothetical protein HGA47_08545 [Zoogloea sp.]|nr:hypothetical protein [Zoogloea sp.]
MLGGASAEAKEFISPLHVRPLIQAYATLIPPVEQELNTAWRNEVLAHWRGLAGKYPFADSSNEASIADISRFLKPGEGILSRFVDRQLAGLVSNRGDQMLPRTWGNLGIRFNPAFLAGITRLSSAGNAVLGEGEGARFELQPVPTPGISEILIEVDGQALSYRNGPQPWTGFSWPNMPGSGSQGARIQVVSFAGVPTSVANFVGRLGLMRLFAQARVEEHGGQTARLEWRFHPAAGEHAMPGGREADAVVRFNFRMVSGGNPLALSSLRRISLPEKITN